MFTWTWLFCLVVMFFICEHKMFTWTLSALSVFSVKVYISFVNVICSRERDYFALWSYSTFVNIKCSREHFLLWVCSQWRHSIQSWQSIQSYMHTCLYLYSSDTSTPIYTSSLGSLLAGPILITCSSMFTWTITNCIWLEKRPKIVHGIAGRALSELWLHWSAAGACANSPPHPARPPRQLDRTSYALPVRTLATGTATLAPAKCAGRPEGRALRPKARSPPSTPNLIVLGTRGWEIDYTDGTNDTLYTRHNYRDCARQLSYTETERPKKI